MNFYHCRLILETETELGSKSRFQYLCLEPKASALPMSYACTLFLKYNLKMVCHVLKLVLESF